MFKFFSILLLFLQVGLAETVEVQHVSDGDTIRVRYQNRSELVRLIGIDAPESHENEKAFKMAKRTHTSVKEILNLGERAANFLESKIKKGDIVELEFDVEKRDQYGRLLAYVYLADHQMANTLILDSGFAHLLTMPPNIKYVNKLRSAYTNGRELKRGLWSFAAFTADMKKESKNSYYR